MFSSIIVLGELYYVARKSSRVESNLQTVGQFGAANRVLGCDSTTAQHYGEIKTLLREKGRGAQLVGEVVQYEDSYRLCYIRGPEGLLIGLAEQLG